MTKNLYDDILELQQAIHKSEKIAKRIHGYISGSRANENARILRNYLKKASQKLNDLYKSYKA